MRRSHEYITVAAFAEFFEVLVVGSFWIDQGSTILYRGDWRSVRNVRANSGVSDGRTLSDRLIAQIRGHIWEKNIYD